MELIIAHATITILLKFEKKKTEFLSVSFPCQPQPLQLRKYSCPFFAFLTLQSFSWSFSWAKRFVQAILFPPTWILFRPSCNINYTTQAQLRRRYVRVTNIWYPTQLEMTLICCWSLQFNLFSFSVLLFYPLVLHTDGDTYGQKHRRTHSDVITLTKISRIDGLLLFSYPWCSARVLHNRLCIRSGNVASRMKTSDPKSKLWIRGKKVGSDVATLDPE